MVKSKLNLLLIILCVVFILCAAVLFAQNNALKANVAKLQEDVENLLAEQDELKLQLSETNAKLTEQTNLATSLQQKLDEANANIVDLNNEKEALLDKIEELKIRLGEPSVTKTE